MKRSFAEINSAQDESSRLRSLHDLKMVLGDSATIDCDQCVGSIQNYYMKCSRMTELHLKMQVCVTLDSLCKCVHLLNNCGWFF